MQQVFDTYAREYDQHFTNSLIGKSQREIVHKYLRSIGDKKRSVLEINCGTGEDALLLSQLFKKVTCTDISEEMINVCNEKIKGINNCTATVCSISDLQREMVTPQDLIFSNFGGLNCLTREELKNFSIAGSFLSQNAELIFVIMGRKCLWERAYFTLKGNKSSAKRRRGHEGAETNLNGKTFKTYYYAPKEIEEMFGENFSLVTRKPVGFFIPPSYLNSFFEKHKIFYSILCNLEKMISSFGFLSDLSDHYLIHLKRK